MICYSYTAENTTHQIFSISIVSIPAKEHLKLVLMTCSRVFHVKLNQAPGHVGGMEDLGCFQRVDDKALQEETSSLD